MEGLPRRGLPCGVHPHHKPSHANGAGSLAVQPRNSQGEHGARTARRVKCIEQRRRPVSGRRPSGQRARIWRRQQTIGQPRHYLSAHLEQRSRRPIGQRRRGQRRQGGRAGQGIDGPGAGVVLPIVVLDTGHGGQDFSRPGGQPLRNQAVTQGVHVAHSMSPGPGAGTIPSPFAGASLRSAGVCHGPPAKPTISPCGLRTGSTAARMRAGP